jgi:hypothetical protein
MSELLLYLYPLGFILFYAAFLRFERSPHIPISDVIIAGAVFSLCWFFYVPLFLVVWVCRYVKWRRGQIDD